MKKLHLLIMLFTMIGTTSHSMYTQSDSTTQMTLAIIKPDAVAAKNSGKIIDHIEAAGFNIVAMKKIIQFKIMENSCEEY